MKDKIVLITLEEAKEILDASDADIGLALKSRKLGVIPDPDNPDGLLFIKREIEALLKQFCPVCGETFLRSNYSRSLRLEDAPFYCSEACKHSAEELGFDRIKELPQIEKLLDDFKINITAVKRSSEPLDP